MTRMKARIIASILIILMLGSIPFVFFDSIQSNAKDDDENCDSSYPDVCIPSPPPDLDCTDIEDKNFKVESPDPHEFDREEDGVGCEN